MIENKIASNNKLGSDAIEAQIKEEFNQNKSIFVYTYPFNTASIKVPAVGDNPERILRFTDQGDKDKALLYKLVVAAYNYVFQDEFASLSSKGRFSRGSVTLVAWLNDAKISNRYSLFKEYEAHCFDMRNNHGGYSELRTTMTLFSYAEKNQWFQRSLTKDESHYLHSLRQTKISPHLNKKQISIASYFGGLDWLRRKDVGIGYQLYQMLASPKLVVSSLKLTVSIIISEFYKLKSTLRQFLKDSGLSHYEFLPPNFKDKTVFAKRVHLGLSIYELLRCYHESNHKPEYLRDSLELVLLSSVTNQANFERVRLALVSKEAMESLFISSKGVNKGQNSTQFADQTFRTDPSGNLLSLEALQQLADESQGLPVTAVERLMFSWLMASLTIQPSDIPKLTKNSFRLLKIGKRISHIECEYFKGRSRRIHNTRTLSTRKHEGKALLVYLKQHEDIDLRTHSGNSLTISSGEACLTGATYKLLNWFPIKSKLLSEHRQQGGTPAVFPKTLLALIENGIHTDNIIPTPKNIPISERKVLVANTETPCTKNLFGLQAIKNSAVYAFSDPYTLHYLVNYNSHTNKTEKLHYTQDNEEWINGAGRITRSVMLDLISNVFDLDCSSEMGADEKGKATVAFNNEFSAVIDNISSKSGEMISRLKVVTEQGKGNINEVGVLSLNERSDDEFAPIYVLDSPVTAFKVFNYLFEFKKNYKKLLSHNPDFFYQTVLPTVEWMEYVLIKLKKSSVKDGEELFLRMRDAGGSVSVFHSI
jgi:hypothetical protein